MTALYDYYELAHLDEGVGSGFRYKAVPHIRLKSIAYHKNEKSYRTTFRISSEEIPQFLTPSGASWTDVFIAKHGDTGGRSPRVQDVLPGWAGKGGGASR